MSNIVKRLTARIQGTTVHAAEGLPEYDKMLEDLSSILRANPKSTGNGYVFSNVSGKCDLKVWVYDPKNGMVKGRVEIKTPFTQMMEKLDQDSREGYIRANFGEGKISEFASRVLAHIRNEAKAQQDDINEDKKSLTFLKSFK